MKCPDLMCKNGLIAEIDPFGDGEPWVCRVCKGRGTVTAWYRFRWWLAGRLHRLASAVCDEYNTTPAGELDQPGPEVGR